MICNLGALYDLVVSQNDLAVTQIVAARKVQHALRTCTHDLHPLQLLACAHLLRFDAPNEGVSICNLTHDVVIRDGNDLCLRRSTLQELYQRRIVALEQDLFSLSQGRSS